MKKLFTTLLFIISITVYGQDTETRNVSSFNEVSLGTSGTLYLTQGNTQKLELKGPEDILKDIETEVRGNKLVIKQEGSWFNWSMGSGKLEIYITMPDIEGLSVSGSGKILGQNRLKTNDLDLSVSGSGRIEIDTNSDDIDISISGSGRIMMAGSASDIETSISGSGRIDAEELKASTYKVRISGSGSCKIYAEESIDARISGSGSVYYKGEPKNVNSSTSGSGRIKKM